MSEPRVIPQALRVVQPIDPVTTTQLFGELKADVNGSLFTTLADPATGTALGVIPVPDIVPTGEMALVTAAASYALDPAGGIMIPVYAGFLFDDGQDINRQALLTFATLSAYNPVADAFDRVRCFAAGEDVTSPESDAGWLATNAALMFYNAGGSALTGVLSADSSAPTVNESDSNWLRTFGGVYLHDGASFGRLGSASAPQLATQSGDQALLAAAPGEWTLTNAAAVNTAATATRAAGAAGVRHVLRSIQASINAVAAIVAPLAVVVRDGASGVGAILWSDRLTAPAGTDGRISVVGLNIVGSAATAMTVEFTAAPGATNFETVSATGYSSAAAAS